MTHITQPKTLKIVILVSLSLIIFNLAVPLLAQAQGVAVFRCAKPNNTEEERDALRRACRGGGFRDSPNAQVLCNARCFSECGSTENPNVCNGGPGRPTGVLGGQSEDVDWEGKKCIWCTYPDGNCTPARCNQRAPLDQSQPPPRFFIEDDQGNLVSQAVTELNRLGISTPSQEEPGIFQKTFNAAKNAFSAVLEFFGLKLGAEVRLPVTFADGLVQSENNAAVNESNLGALRQQIAQTIALLEKARTDSAKISIAAARVQETANAVRNQSQQIANYAVNTEKDLNTELANLTTAGYSQDEMNEARRGVDDIINELRNMGRIANTAYEKAKNLDSLPMADALTIPQYLAVFLDMDLSVGELFKLNSNLQKALAKKTEKQKDLADKDREKVQETSDAIVQAIDQAQQTTDIALKDGVISKNEQKALNKIANNLDKVSDTFTKVTRGTDEQTQDNAQGLVSASKNTSSTLKGLSQQKDVSPDAAAAALADIDNNYKRVLETKSVLKKSTEIAKGVELLMSLIMEAARRISPEAEISQLLSGNTVADITNAFTGGRVLAYAVNNTGVQERVSLVIAFNDRNGRPVAHGQTNVSLASKTISPIYAEAPTGDPRALTAAIERLDNGNFTISSETQNGGEEVGLLSELPKPLSPDDQKNIIGTVEQVVSGLGIARDAAQNRMNQAADLAKQLFGELADFFGGGEHLDENGVANLPSGTVQVNSAITSPDGALLAFALKTGTPARGNGLGQTAFQQVEEQFICGRGSGSVAGGVFSCGTNLQTAILSVTADSGQLTVFIGEPDSDYNPNPQYSFGVIGGPCDKSVGPILQNYEPLSNPFAFLIPRAQAYYITDPGTSGGGGGAYGSGEWVFETMEFLEFANQHPEMSEEQLTKLFKGREFVYRVYKHGTKASDLPPWEPWTGKVSGGSFKPGKGLGPRPHINDLLSGKVRPTPPPPLPPKPTPKPIGGGGKPFGGGTLTAVNAAAMVALVGQACTSDEVSDEEYERRSSEIIGDVVNEGGAAGAVVGTALEILEEFGGPGTVAGLFDLVFGSD